MKRFRTIILLCGIVMYAAMGTVNAQTSGTTGPLTWSFNEETGVLTITGEGAMPNYGQYQSPWDSYRDFIDTVEIDSGVTTIGDYAFSYCYALTSVTIPESVVAIGNNAFHYSYALPSVTIPESVAAIGNNAFHSCYSLTSVNIPELITAIGDRVFYYCPLASITIPESVTSIGVEAFSNTALSSVTIPESVVTIGESAFSGNYALTSIAIPELVTSIEEYVFYGCGALVSVTMGSSVTSIGDGAFGTTGFTSFTIPESVTSVGNRAFYSCLSLASVTIPESVISIGDEAFSRTALTSVSVPESVTSIGNYVFRYCSGLTSIDVAPANPNYSSESGVLFNKNKTVLIQCPPGKAGEYNIPGSVTTIADCAFSNCKELTSVTIPNSVVTIGETVFPHCSKLTSIIIPNSVTTIGREAFYYNETLTSVTIGSSVATIGEYAFMSCTGLTEIINRAETPQEIIPNVFEYVDKYGCTLYVPAASVALYEAARGWRLFENIEGMVAFTISLSANPTAGGEVTGDGTYSEGEEITITATPAAHYTFVNWTEDGEEVENANAEYTFTVTGDRTLVANFALQQFEVTYNVTDEDGEPLEGAVIVFNGETLDGYTASGITAGEYDYTVSKEGYTTATGTVEVIDQNVTEDVTLGTVGIDDNTLTSITIYGSEGNVYIVNKNNINLKSVQILDVLGRVVYSGKAGSSVTIPVNGANGIYVVRLVSDDNKVSSTKVHLTR